MQGVLRLSLPWEYRPVSSKGHSTEEEMSHCEGFCCVKAIGGLTLLLGRRLSHLTVSTEPGDRGTGGPHALHACKHPCPSPTSQRGWLLCCVGLCSWFSFAFSFKTELSPWELVRRALAGGGASRTFPSLQGRPRPLFQEISAAAHTHLSSPKCPLAHMVSGLLPLPPLLTVSTLAAPPHCVTPMATFQSPLPTPHNLPPASLLCCLSVLKTRASVPSR